MKKQIFITILSASTLFSPFVYAAHHKNTITTADTVLTITRNASFDLDLSPEQALPLFTGPGETLWIPKKYWNPVYLYGDGFVKGSIFLTQNGDATSYWQVLDYNTEKKHAAYSRVTPGSDTAIINVSLKQNDHYGSTVNVRYQVTALSEAGNAMIKQQYSKHAYAKEIQSWKKMIDESKEVINTHFNY